MRPIVNMNHKAKGASSANARLQNAFSVLSHEQKRPSNQLTDCSLSMAQVYRHIQAYRTSVAPLLAQGQRPSIIKFDVAQCFDSIDPHRLYALLQELIVHDTYVLHRHTTLSIHNDRLIKQLKRKAQSSEQTNAFAQQFQQRSAQRWNTLFLDKGHLDNVPRKNIVRVVHQHLFNNKVAMRGSTHVYQQTHGIPQGSVLSTLLCKHVLQY
jgi:telomerase reverse transcriptase